MKAMSKKGRSEGPKSSLPPKKNVPSEREIICVDSDSSDNDDGNYAVSSQLNGHFQKCFDGTLKTQADSKMDIFTNPKCVHPQKMPNEFSIPCEYNRTLEKKRKSNSKKNNDDDFDWSIFDNDFGLNGTKKRVREGDGHGQRWGEGNGHEGDEMSSIGKDRGDLESEELKRQLNCNDLWIYKYSPKNLSELVVNCKKVSQVAEEILGMLGVYEMGHTCGTRVKCLILTGPSGAGKSETVKLLLKYNLVNEFCQSSCGTFFNLQVVEYKDSIPYGGFEADAMERTSYENRLSLFASQLTRSKYPFLPMLNNGNCCIESQNNSILIGKKTVCNKKIFLIEELPYLHDEEQRSRMDWILCRHLRDERGCPVVMVVSDDDSRGGCLAVWNYFRRAFLDNPAVKVIKFNAIADGVIRKVLDRILKCERLNVPRGEVDALVQTASGDIRSAINTLQMMVRMRKGELNLLLSGSGGRRGTVGIGGLGFKLGAMMKKARKSNVHDQYTRVNMYPDVSKDPFTPLFHSIGKILHVRRINDGDVNDANMRVRSNAEHFLIPKGSKLYREPLKANPELIYELSCTEKNNDSFTRCLFENYLRFSKQIERTSMASEHMSFADTLKTFRSEPMMEYLNLIFIRGLLFAHHDCDKSYQALYTKSIFKIEKITRENDIILEQIYEPYVDDYGYIIDDKISSSCCNSTFLDKHSLHTEIMPFQHLILKKKNSLTNSELSFIRTLCRYSGSNKPSHNHHTPIDPTEDHETFSPDDFARFSIIKSNIANERSKKKSSLFNIASDYLQLIQQIE